MSLQRYTLLTLLCLAAARPLAGAPAERTERFDRDPGWDGLNHRSKVIQPVEVTQSFGYSPTSHAGGKKGEAGGFITPDSQPAYYARRIPTKTLEDVFSASGKLNCTGRAFHVLLGFFNAGTVNEWRTPNSIALRLLGRGDRFYAYVEYCTRKWRAGGDSPGGFATVGGSPRGFSLREPHTWSITYDPKGNGGAGAVVVTLDGETSVCYLRPGHKSDGATFNRFGLLNAVKSVDGAGEVWIDDVTVLGHTESFDRDPGWEGRNNRRRYLSKGVRPLFDFGFSATRFCRGEGRGELGGTVYRGDCRHPGRLAHYGDRVGPLSPKEPLRAAGKVCLRRGVSDSTVLLGFYNSQESLRVSDDQRSGEPSCFLGVAIGGPSREGFFLGPAYRFRGGGSSDLAGARAPRIYPDGTAHHWSLTYQPPSGGSPARMTVTLDDHSVEVELPPEKDLEGVSFDRFGIVTTWIDGNAQEVYFDDLTYTVSQ